MQQPPRKPFEVSAEEELAKKQQAEFEIALAYKRVFSSADGTVVLADLKRQCRFDQWEMPRIDRTDPSPIENIALLAAAKGLIHHINSQVNLNLAAKEEKRQKIRKTQKQQTSP